MAKKNRIVIYADEFDYDVWQEYCEICNVPTDATSIEIKFNDKDVSYDKEK